MHTLFYGAAGMVLLITTVFLLTYLGDFSRKRKQRTTKSQRLSKQMKEGIALQNRIALSMPDYNWEIPAKAKSNNRPQDTSHPVL